MTEKQPKPAGEILLNEYMKSRGVNQLQLSKELGISTTYVHAIVHGSKPITKRVAGLLQDYFDTPDQMWLVLQAQYKSWENIKCQRQKNIQD